MMPSATRARAPEFISPTFIRAIAILAAIYVSFLAMEAVHEFGHALNAWSSGGRVVDVRFPLLGTSQTVVDPNPYPRFVAEGGPQWGIVIPLLACGLAHLTRRRVPEPLKFFAGFCLIVNGIYMGVGPAWRNTDASDLIRMNVPLGAIFAYGIGATACGLAIWHRLSWLTWKR